MSRLIFYLVPILALTSCVKFARVEYGYPSQYLDSTTGARFKPTKGIIFDIGGGERYDAGSGETGPIVQMALRIGQDSFQIRGHVETTIPEFNFSGGIGIEVEF
jgi:hypothetical protein